MNKPMIENSDRGITLNKSLAWTVLVGVLSGGIWVGMQVTSAKQGVQTLAARQDEDRLDIRKNTSDITAIRSNNARLDQRLTNIEQSARRTEETVSEILRYLRDGR
ncbi:MULTISPECIES: hypothetical protein [unclassified Mameliella]|uniref:hypothetical protein n=1 Tax=unclassified Mameliella TaxID=2630630 RepID=UPI00273D5C76|nr:MULTISPECIES: hypothetical protein [unclassified Mameliella]